MRAEVAHCHAAFILANTPDKAHHVKEAQRLYGLLEMTPWCERVLGVAESGSRAYC
jgi:hypothetical protein